ncbi:hypothetical protein [Streptomyces sp. NRRL S-350]|uniref:hypothetical protein n=1 Tax=Streptomyces sp. NRRL S-350 TaxID=1463902 RepID=UPI0004BFE2F1|nr:hypothetical protein [Streptomyces sp. NRRL S-350]
MATAETPLRDEYAAAVEQVAGRVLAVLRDGEAVTALAAPGTVVPRPLLAAVRVTGADLFAPQLFTGADPDETDAALLAEARRALPAPAPSSEQAAAVIGWQDWAAGQLLARTAYAGAVPVPAPLPGPDALGWLDWSKRMAQLSVLALPTLDGPVHDTARANTLDLARGTVRCMLRRDLATAVRLARWLAWARADGRPLRLELEPVLDRIRLAGDGTARSVLELTIARRLLNGAPR